jgi:hypothetical protein
MSMYEAEPLVSLARDFVDTMCRREPTAFTRKSALESAFATFLEVQHPWEALYYNKLGERRHRNHVLKAVLLDSGFSFRTEYRHDDGSRSRDVFLGVST